MESSKRLERPTLARLHLPASKAGFRHRPEPRAYAGFFIDRPQELQFIASGVSL